VANSLKQTGNIARGRGYGSGTHGTAGYAGAVVEIEVNKKSGKITAKNIFNVFDVGLAVNPGLVANQQSGASIMGLSRVLHESVNFNKNRVTSLDWVTYPILRFADHPSVTLINVHPGQYTVITPGSTTGDVSAGNTAAFSEGWLATGSGEPPGTAIGSAMANGFFDATGVRIRQAPMRPPVVRDVLRAAGIT
jgi:CO/xanthine dehydrogenase Mo-binding subunit